MFGHDNAYSRLVFWLKIVLPLAALGILSTMFLVGRSIDPSRAIPLSKVDVTELARESRITAPTYAGVTRDGAQLVVSAGTARTDAAKAPRRADATKVAATLTAPDGRVTRMHADRGTVDPAKNRLTLDGNVVIDTANDYRIHGPKLGAALDKSWLEASGGISAMAPMGHITARALTIRPDPAKPGSYVLVFKNRVRLLYRPGN